MIHRNRWWSSHLACTAVTSTDQSGPILSHHPKNCRRSLLMGHRVRQNTDRTDLVTSDHPPQHETHGQISFSFPRESTWQVNAKPHQSHRLELLRWMYQTGTTQHMSHVLGYVLGLHWTSTNYCVCVGIILSVNRTSYRRMSTAS